MIILNIILIVIFVLLCVCYWIQKGSHSAKLLNAFPQAGTLIPIVGHVHLLSTKPDVLFSILRELLKKFNQTFALWAGIYSTLQVVTADDAEIILSNAKHINKGLLYLSFGQWLQTGLLTSSGNKWHRRRKMLTPAFHYNILQMFVDVFGEQCDNITKTLKEECRNAKTNINPIITMMTLSTICETSMGIKLDQNNNHLTEYYNALYSMSKIFVERAFSPWLHPDIIYNSSPTGRHERKLVKYLHKFTADIIKTREETFQDEDVINLESTDKKPKKRLAMLDLLLYSKRHLGEIDDEGIREEVDTFVFEGHDTISSAARFALATLAHNKPEQNKIIEELDEIFGNSQRHATYDDMQNMKYLERCIKECLRLYPSVPFIGRKLREDTPLTHHVAPAGTEVVMHIYNIHRDPKYYPDPEKFDPDRFLLKNLKDRPPYAYIPFSAGLRNCIGQRYAMLQIKAIISAILRNFGMEPIDALEDLTWIVDLVLRTKEPIHIKFVAREKV